MANPNPLPFTPAEAEQMTADEIVAAAVTAFGPRELHPTTPLHTLLKTGPTLESRLAALWTLHSTGLLDENWLEQAAEDKEPAIRAWAARLVGERGFLLKDSFDLLYKLSKDPDPTVRLGVAVAARRH